MGSDLDEAFVPQYMDIGAGLDGVLVLCTPPDVSQGLCTESIVILLT